MEAVDPEVSFLFDFVGFVSLVSMLAFGLSSILEVVVDPVLPWSRVVCTIGSLFPCWTFRDLELRERFFWSGLFFHRGRAFAVALGGWRCQRLSGRRPSFLWIPGRILASYCRFCSVL